MKTRNCRSKRLHRSRRRNKRVQYGKGVTDVVEPLTKAIQHAFPHFQYEVESSPAESVVGVDIYCTNEVFHNDIPSITMTIRDDEIFVNTLARCKDPEPSSAKSMRGTEVLKGIIAIGRELKSLGIKYIRLKDASQMYFMNLPCGISLSGYMILTSDTHHSWYNAYGFKSDRYEEEVKTNTAFSQQPMMDLLYMIHAHRVNKKKNPLGNLFGKSTKSNWRASANQSDGLVKELIDVYEGNVTPDQSIQEGIQRIHQLAQQAASCKSPIITFYRDAMKAAFEYGITYDNRLVYTL